MERLLKLGAGQILGSAVKRQQASREYKYNIQTERALQKAAGQRIAAVIKRQQQPKGQSIEKITPTEAATKIQTAIRKRQAKNKLGQMMEQQDIEKIIIPAIQGAIRGKIARKKVEKLRIEAKEKKKDSKIGKVIKGRIVRKQIKPLIESYKKDIKDIERDKLIETEKALDRITEEQKTISRNKVGIVGSFFTSKEDKNKKEKVIKEAQNLIKANEMIIKNVDKIADRKKQKAKEVFQAKLDTDSDILAARKKNLGQLVLSQYRQYKINISKPKRDMTDFADKYYQYLRSLIYRRPGGSVGYDANIDYASLYAIRRLINLTPEQAGYWKKKQDEIIQHIISFNDNLKPEQIINEVNIYKSNENKLFNDFKKQYNQGPIIDEELKRIKEAERLVAEARRKEQIEKEIMKEEKIKIEARKKAQREKEIIEERARAREKELEKEAREREQKLEEEARREEEERKQQEKKVKIATTAIEGLIAINRGMMQANQKIAKIDEDVRKEREKEREKEKQREKEKEKDKLQREKDMRKIFESLIDDLRKAFDKYDKISIKDLEKKYRILKDEVRVKFNKISITKQEKREQFKDTDYYDELRQIINEYNDRYQAENTILKEAIELERKKKSYTREELDAMSMNEIAKLLIRNSDGVIVSPTKNTTEYDREIYNAWNRKNYAYNKIKR